MAKEVVSVHHADRRRDVMMPYAPALLVRRGALVFLSGVTAAPVYHSHPHLDEEFDLPENMREQAALAMENLVKTLAAAGCTLADVVSATRYLTDVREQDDLNRVWASYLGDHLPTTTTVEVSRLATHARCKIEISAIAVADAPPPRGRAGIGNRAAGARTGDARSVGARAAGSRAAEARGTGAPTAATRAGGSRVADLRNAGARKAGARGAGARTAETRGRGTRNVGARNAGGAGSRGKATPSGRKRR